MGDQLCSLVEFSVQFRQRPMVHRWRQNGAFEAHALVAGSQETAKYSARAAHRGLGKPSARGLPDRSCTRNTAVHVMENATHVDEAMNPMYIFNTKPPPLTIRLRVTSGVSLSHFWQTAELPNKKRRSGANGTDAREGWSRGRR